MKAGMLPPFLLFLGTCGAAELEPGTLEDFSPRFAAKELHQIYRREAIEHVKTEIAGGKLTDLGGGVWWEHHYARTNTSFVRFHFEQIRTTAKLDFKLEILRDPGSRHVATYDGSVFAADDTFSTDLLPGGRLRLRLLAPTRPDGLSFRWGHATWEGSLKLTPESGVARYDFVKALPEGKPESTQARQAARALARLVVGPFDVGCSGVLVREDLVATNYHCMEYSLSFQRAKGTIPAACRDVSVEFDFLERGVRGVPTRCEAVTFADAGLDIAILKIDPEKIRLAGKPRAPIPFRPESEGTPIDVIILHHPRGLPAAIETRCRRRNVLQLDIFHDCWTGRGSSGSALLDHQLRLVGIHYLGPYPVTWTIEQAEKDQEDNGARYNQARAVEAIRKVLAGLANP